MQESRSLYESESFMRGCDMAPNQNSLITILIGKIGLGVLVFFPLPLKGLQPYPKGLNYNRHLCMKSTTN